VAFGILPIFAFANAGVDLAGMRLSKLLDPIPLGILLGLFVGKQVGVFSFAWLAVKSGLARLPEGVNFAQVYGAAILCGIGFTMSLFIGMLAFENVAASEVIVTDQLGILAGTLLSAIAGSLVLYLLLRPSGPEQVVEQDAAEHGEPEQVVVEKSAEALRRIAPADQVLLVQRGGHGNGETQPVPATELREVTRQREQRQRAGLQCRDDAAIRAAE
jgi:hypothetical protein